MSAVVAAIFWHLKALAPNKLLFYVAMAIALLALAAVFVVFIGRTGQLVGLAMVSLTIFWALPRRWRIATLLVPPLVFLFAVFSVDKVAQRLAFTKTEIAQYSAGVGAATSADNRLDFWRGSVVAIIENPLVGSGLGGWTTTYNKIQKNKYPTHKDLSAGGNPHQEFLLWGVQLGIGGIVLLLAFLSAAMLDLLKMSTPITRAG